MSEKKEALLEVRDLAVEYTQRSGHGHVCAVNGVSLWIEEGEVVGLVGESGCGKSSLGNAILGLVPLASGGIYFGGEPVHAAAGVKMREYRRAVQMIFQDPMGALHPRLTVGAAIEEVLFVHSTQLELRSLAARQARRRELMEQVGLGDDFASRYPHELSGGQRQRVGIARALAVSPCLLVADEPVSALDVSVQVQILNLLKDISQTLSVACLFIAHDLAVVRYMCKRTYVMYMGSIVEEGMTDDVFDNPAHPYTRALIAAVPDVGRGLAAQRAGQVNELLVGEPGRRCGVEKGCVFQTRCPIAVARCFDVPPPAVSIHGEHRASCFLAKQSENGKKIK